MFSQFLFKQSPFGLCFPTFARDVATQERVSVITSMSWDEWGSKRGKHHVSLLSGGNDGGRHVMGGERRRPAGPVSRAVWTRGARVAGCSDVYVARPIFEMAVQNI